MATILIVDDDESIRTVVSTLLEDFGGHAVLEADGGLRGIEVMRAKRPDLVLMDVQMPGIDGPRAFERMRADEAIASIPVAFMTANNLKADVEHYMGLGAIGVVKKPFDPRDFLLQVSALLALPTSAR